MVIAVKTKIVMIIVIKIEISIIIISIAVVMMIIITDDAPWYFWIQLLCKNETFNKKGLVWLISLPCLAICSNSLQAPIVANLHHHCRQTSMQLCPIPATFFPSLFCCANPPRPVSSIPHREGRRFLLLHHLQHVSYIPTLWCIFFDIIFCGRRNNDDYTRCSP